MSTPRIYVDDAVTDEQSELWFAEPSGFIPLPLTSLLAKPGSPEAEAMCEAVAPLLEAAPSAWVRQQFVAQLALGQQMLGALCGFGTVHCSLGLHRDDVGGGGQPLLSLFTITWQDTPVASRAATAARAVTAPDGHRRVAYLELPCGPATVSETLRPPMTGSPLPRLPLLQVHAHLPHPDCKRLAVLTVSSTAATRRAEYRAVLEGIADTVRFTDPLGALS
ncbi:hypothetical protein [Streptomyces ardesiacus]|uniref:hypothetical protein n=1 Tax=Streptomyces ardesiacus TaxID=285564 RepID=UPI000D597517|nr:hypothetical protein [Streptomyces ardesiacus]